MDNVLIIARERRWNIALCGIEETRRVRLPNGWTGPAESAAVVDRPWPTTLLVPSAVQHVRVPVGTLIVSYRTTYTGGIAGDVAMRAGYVDAAGVITWGLLAVGHVGRPATVTLETGDQVQV